jgi:hypothetical protein
MLLKRMQVLLVVMVLSLISASGQTNLRAAMTSDPSNFTQRPINFQALTPDEKSKKSVVLAIAYSLVLPGLGEYYADNFGTGKYFMGADASLWIAYGGVRAYGVWLKDDARTLAVQRAGADFDGKNDAFEVNVRDYLDVTAYNDDKMRNRQFDLIYDPNSSFAWRWASESDRQHFRDLRNRGESALRTSQFVVGALVLNRVISAFSAARSVLAYNRSLPALGSWRVSAAVPGGLLAADGIELRLTREF